MTQLLPIYLSGNNLGERHRHLNSLVKDAFLSSTTFDSIYDLPEAAPLDRLFKIELASKHRNVDYIIKNLKDPDMLFISKALKCTWLLNFEYKDIINPIYLERELFPQMTKTAICKMQHWIQHHLRDPERCKDFYLYYKEKQFKIAIKFLWHCSNEYLLEEFKNIVDRIDARNLKVLSEKCPQLIRQFYENIEQDQNILKVYLNDEISFFSNIKYIMKSDPETFFEVIEKYLNVHKFHSFGPDVTKQIMVNHKKIFFNKPELYTAWLLDINIVAKYLNHDEVKEVVLKLARAEYLENWFTYKNVEPLIKRLNKEERVAFKNLVFVDKTIGDKIKDWPYKTPCSPVLKEIPGYGLFQDREHVRKLITKRTIKRRKGSGYEKICIHVHRTLLDDLFDRFRFMSFEKTLFDLRKRLKAENNMQNREFMMLVLVSKTGGREDSIRTLLELLLQYKNEPVHFRAAIFRSLVKRAFIWRLPDDLWTSLLQWAHGMGLDGTPSEIECTEGVHAVVLRNLLISDTFDPVASKLLFDNFTYLTEYSLDAAERTLLRIRLPKLLLDAAVKKTGYEKRAILEQLLSTLDGYKITFDKLPGLIEAIETAAQEDRDSCEYLLIRVYNARIARKLYFKDFFYLIHDNASYVNALRHDISVINIDANDKFLEIIENEPYSCHKLFLRKLAIYFAEPGGIAEQFQTFFKHLAETTPKNCLAKPLTLLLGKYITTLLKNLDNALEKSPERRLAAALRANFHNTRPRIQLYDFGWQAAGAKSIANFICTYPQNQVNHVVDRLLTWGRTIRLALTITDNEDVKYTAFKIMAESRPGVALKMFLRCLKVGKLGSECVTIWNTVKHLITNLDYAERSRLCTYLMDVKAVPMVIKPEYCVLVYEALTKIKNCDDMALTMLFNIENMCYEVNQSSLSYIVNTVVENMFGGDRYCEKQKTCLYIRLTTKYTLLSDSVKSQEVRMKTLEKLLQQMKYSWETNNNYYNNILYLETFLEALKYNKAFFNNEYISCMSVFERVLSWLHSTFAIEQWFDIYIKLHLTMLYYKVARICISQKPDFFTNESIDRHNLDKGIDMFGTIFGIFVARDYEELAENYFKSIKEIYRKAIMDFFTVFIDYASFDHSKEIFVIAFIKHILNEKEAKEAKYLANYVFEEHEKYYFKHGNDLSAIKDILKETTCNENELRFYLLNKSNDII